MRTIWLIAATLALASACARQLWIGRNPTEAQSPSGPMDLCAPCEKQVIDGAPQFICPPCKDSGSASADRFAGSGTQHFKLPQCPPNLVLDGLLIEDAQTGSPRLLYQCAPPSAVLDLDAGMRID